MLRHLKDIRSPIAVAASKHATRREKRAKEAGGLGVGSAPVAVADAPPGSAGLEVAVSGEMAGTPGPHPQPLPSPSSRQAIGYCISIYPYVDYHSSTYVL